MESQEKRASEQIVRMLNILRNVTAYAKVVPFLYALLYIVGYSVYIVQNEYYMVMVDMIFYVSPINCLIFFGMSYILKFCNWYRLQCSLPLLPSLLVIVDEYFYELTDINTEVTLACVIIVFILSLINAYFLFIRKCDCNCQRY